MLLHASGGDSAWEKISNFADSGEDIPSARDDYAALTAQLAASGPAAGTRARSQRPTSDVSTLLISGFCAVLQGHQPVSLKRTAMVHPAEGRFGQPGRRLGMAC